ncbi:NHL repeat-containing protein [Nocardia sp. NPDC004750]
MSTAAIAIEAITTVAGTGTEGYGGDNQPAIDADLDYPEGVAVDGAGNLYIAERYNYRVRKVDHATGVITTVAGTGTAGYNGDNQPAIDADLNAPFGVAVDGAGNLYIVDRVNYRVRKVDHGTGVITTVAGTGTGGYNGDNQPAIDAYLDYPEGVAVDGAGDLYIADLRNHRVRKVDHGTGVITTVAGTGTAGYNGDSQPAIDAELHYPNGVAVDGAGNLYIADSGNQRVRRVDPAGIITTVGGTGTPDYNGDNQPAIDAELDAPDDVAVDGSGNLYIADLHNQRVRRVDPAGIITTVAGTGTGGYNGDNQPAIDAELDAPNDVVVDGAGNLYIADVDNQRVRRVDPAGIITTVAGTGTEGYNGDNRPAIDAELNQPCSVAVDGSGNLYIADLHNERVRRVNPAGVITTVAGTGAHGYNGDNRPAIDADLSYPVGVAVDGSGNLYIADLYNQRVRRVDHATGVITTVAGTGTDGYDGDNQPAIDVDLDYPGGVAVDGAGNLYIADTGNKRVRRVEAVVFSVVQDPPDPVVMTAGVTTRLAFTVSANTTVTAGQTITLGFPSGVGLAPDGVVRHRCPDTGIDTPLPVTVGADGSVSVTAPEITASTACFYTADVQASTIPEGTVSIGGTTQPIHFRINL